MLTITESRTTIRATTTQPTQDTTIHNHRSNAWKIARLWPPPAPWLSLRVTEYQYGGISVGRGDLTFSFGFPLRSGGFALCTDLREAGQIGFSFVGLALDMQLATP